MKNSIIPFYGQIDNFIVRSEGCYLYDAGNRQYIDFESGDWAALLGHTHARINQVIRDQCELLMHDGLRFRNKSSEELAVRLQTLLSFRNGKCVFLNSGSEAVNLGITMAKNITGRHKLLKTDCSYLAAFGHGQIYSPNPDIVNITLNDMDAIASIDFSDIAAFVFEPGNARGLVKLPTVRFIQSLSEAVTRHGGLLMANEVTTGFRTGKWFGYQHYPFQPDIVAMGKALGNGYPISSIAISEKVAGLFDKTPFRYAQSHQNDPLGCVVALEVLKIIEEEDVIGRCAEKGKYFLEQLLQLRDTYPELVDQVRGRGLMLGIEFRDHVNVSELYLKLLEQGILVGYRNHVICLMPPVIISNEDIDRLCSAISGILITFHS